MFVRPLKLHRVSFSEGTVYEAALYAACLIVGALSCKAVSKSNRFCDLAELNWAGEAPIVSSARNKRLRIRRRDIMKNLLTNNLIASAPLAVAAIAMVASVVA